MDSQQSKQLPRAENVEGYTFYNVLLKYIMFKKQKKYNVYILNLQ